MEMLKIKQCLDSSLWYASKVGKVVPMLGYTEDGYKSREDRSEGGWINVVKYEDASVVDV